MYIVFSLSGLIWASGQELHQARYKVLMEAKGQELHTRTMRYKNGNHTVIYIGNQHVYLVML
jgi:hypothetical protein